MHACIRCCCWHVHYNGHDDSPPLPPPPRPLVLSSGIFVLGMLYEGPNVGRSRKPNFIGSGVVSKIATLDVCETMCREWTAVRCVTNPTFKCLLSLSLSLSPCCLGFILIVRVIGLLCLRRTCNCTVGPRCGVNYYSQGPLSVDCDTSPFLLEQSSPCIHVLDGKLYMLCYILLRLIL